MTTSVTSKLMSMAITKCAFSIILVIVALVVALAGNPLFKMPPAHAREAAVDFDNFSKAYSIVLAFDLQHDERLQAALIVNSNLANSEPDINIALPFKISDESTNERALFRVGRYSAWTLITFSNRTKNIWPQGLSFVPEVERSNEAYITSNSGGKSVYLIAEGQVRRFRYRYPNARSSRSLATAPSGSVRNPDAIAIALPTGAQEFAVRDGHLSIPARLVPNERAFPAIASDPNEQFLEIAYQVPPTDLQKLIVKWGVKVLGALLPIAGLFVLSAEQIRNQRLRLGLTIFGSVAFVGVLAAVMWAAWNAADGGDVIADLLLLLGSATISALLFWSKAKLA